eukprot:scaffold107332_cov24-Prasinocladus_malaysianus.AAC.1
MAAVQARLADCERQLYDQGEAASRRALATSSGFSMELAQLNQRAAQAERAAQMDKAAKQRVGHCFTFAPSVSSDPECIYCICLSRLYICVYILSAFILVVPSINRGFFPGWMTQFSRRVAWHQVSSMFAMCAEQHAQ